MTRAGLFSGKRNILLTLLGVLILTSIAYLYSTYQQPPPPTTTTTTQPGATTTTQPGATTTTQPGATTTTITPQECDGWEIKCLDANYKQTCMNNRWQTTQCSSGCKSYYDQPSGKTYHGCEDIRMVNYGIYAGNTWYLNAGISKDVDFQIGMETSNFGDVPVYTARKVYFADPTGKVFSKDSDWRYETIYQGDKLLWDKKFSGDICAPGYCSLGTWYHGVEIWRWDIPAQSWKIYLWSGWVGTIQVS